MKTFNNFIIEKLKLNKDNKLFDENKEKLYWLFGLENYDKNSISKIYDKLKNGIDKWYVDNDIKGKPLYLCCSQEHMIRNDNQHNWKINYYKQLLLKFLKSLKQSNELKSLWDINDPELLGGKEAIFMGTGNNWYAAIININ